MRPVVFDIDGVLADFMFCYTQLAGKVNPEVPMYSTGAQPEWNGLDRWLSEKETSEVWRRIESDPRFWFSLPPLTSRGDVMHVRELAEWRRVAYCTSRVGETAQSQTEEWLKYHNFPAGDVIVARDKVAALEEFGSCWVLEDYYENFAALRKARHDVYLLDRPYNRPDARLDEVFYRVSTVAEFCCLVGRNQ